jgi:hypothetical protein
LPSGYFWQRRKNKSREPVSRLLLWAVHALRAAPVMGENKKMAWLAVTAGLKLEGCLHEGV